jgi:hypothetical protein
MKFDRITDLKQIKTDEELIKKCNEIKDSLKDFTKAEKYRILNTLYGSYIDCCKKEGITFFEFPNEKGESWI